MLYVRAMAKVLCPYCGERARFAPRLFGSPYCIKCGWRLEGAEKSSKGSAFLLPGLAFLGLLGFFGAIIQGWPIAIDCVFLACLVLWPGLLGAVSWLDYTKIVAAEPQTVSPKREDWTVRANEKYAPLLTLPAPRAVSISWKGWVRILVGAACLGIGSYVLFAAGDTRDFGSHFVQNLSNRAFPISILLVIGVWANLNLIRQRWSHVPLLQSGSVVVGKVLQQKYQNITIGLDLIGRYSLVEYEFHDQQGLPVRGGGHDYTKSLFQEAPTLIFYDSKDPFRNVAFGCSLYTIGNRR